MNNYENLVNTILSGKTIDKNKEIEIKKETMQIVEILNKNNKLKQENTDKNIYFISKIIDRRIQRA